MAIDLKGRIGDATQKFVESISAMVERELASRIQAEVARVTSAAFGGKRLADGRRRTGRKLDMRCRYPGCKNRSKGPRFHFLCEDHLKQGKSAVAKARKAAEATESKSA